MAAEAEEASEAAVAVAPAVRREVVVEVATAEAAVEVVAVAIHEALRWVAAVAAAVEMVAAEPAATISITEVDLGVGQTRPHSVSGIRHDKQLQNIPGERHTQ